MPCQTENNGEYGKATKHTAIERYYLEKDKYIYYGFFRFLKKERTRQNS